MPRSHYSLVLDWRWIKQRQKQVTVVAGFLQSCTQSVAAVDCSVVTIMVDCSTKVVAAVCWHACVQSTLRVVAHRSRRAVSQHRHLAVSRNQLLAVHRNQLLAASRNQLLAVHRNQLLAATQHPHLAVVAKLLQHLAVVVKSLLPPLAIAVAVRLQVVRSWKAFRTPASISLRAKPSFPAAFRP